MLGKREVVERRDSRRPRFRRIALMVLTGLVSVSAWATDPIVEGELGEKLDAYLTRLEALGISGAYLFEKGGEIVLAKGYGLADKESEIAMTRDTVSTVGSITKQFTAAAIMKLEMGGRLEVSDRIGKFFDDVPKDKREITVHHLLTHTSGLRDSFGPDFRPISRDEFLAKAMDGRLKFEIGERHFYSNGGYSLLGIIIELLTEKSYEEYLREVFFEPLGMDHTGYLLPQWEKGALAVGYEDDERWGSIKDHPWDVDGPYWNLRANGGILSTVDDMYAWHLALLDDRVLSDEAREKMFTQHVLEEPNDPDPSWYYGYGWAIATTERDTKLITHNGGNGIFFADFRRYVDDDAAFFYMTNTAQSFTGKNERDLRRILFGFEVDLPPLPEEDAE